MNTQTKTAIAIIGVAAVAFAGYQYNRYQKGIKDTREALQRVDQELSQTMNDALKLFESMAADATIKAAKRLDDPYATLAEAVSEYKKLITAIDGANAFSQGDAGQGISASAKLTAKILSETAKELEAEAVDIGTVAGPLAKYGGVAVDLGAKLFEARGILLHFAEMKRTQFQLEKSLGDLQRAEAIDFLNHVQDNLRNDQALHEEWLKQHGIQTGTVLEAAMSNSSANAGPLAPSEIARGITIVDQNEGLHNLSGARAPTAATSKAVRFGTHQGETRRSFVPNAAAALISPEFGRQSELGAGGGWAGRIESIQPSAFSPNGQKPLLSKTAALNSSAGLPYQNALTAPGNQPPTFIENKGQFDERVRMQLRGNGRTAWLTNSGIVFDFLRSKTSTSDSASHEARSIIPHLDALELDPQSALTAPQSKDVERLVISEDFVGGNAAPVIETKIAQPGIYNYFLGNDPSEWRSDVRGYGEVTYRDIWDGVDLKLYGRGADLEQEFIVVPGADLSRVRISYEGVDGLAVAGDGSLLMRTAFGHLRESKPKVYQEISGKRVAVKARFRLTSGL